MVISNIYWLAYYKVAHADSLFLSLREREGRSGVEGGGGKKNSVQALSAVRVCYNNDFLFPLVAAFEQKKRILSKTLLLAATFSTFT